MMGMAARARRAVTGSFSVEQAVKSGKACLVVVTTDASDNTKKQMKDMCTFYQVPVREYAAKEDLGHAMGKEERAAAALCDPGFAKAVLKLIDHIPVERR